MPKTPTSATSRTNVQSDKVGIGGELAVTADIFNALESVHAKSLVIVMVPAFAIALRALLVDRRVPFRHLLTFSTHFFAFALIWLCALFPAVAVVLDLVALSAQARPSPHSIDLVISGLEAGVLGWYLYEALKTVYGLSRLRRSITSISLIVALWVILKVYHVVVFAVTLYSTYESGRSDASQARLEAAIGLERNVHVPPAERERRCGDDSLKNRSRNDFQDIIGEPTSLRGAQRSDALPFMKAEQAVEVNRGLHAPPGKRPVPARLHRPSAHETCKPLRILNAHP
jgi:hypothetical protein